MPANLTFPQESVTKTLSLDGDPADTLPFADKTFQLLYAAAPKMGGKGNTAGGGGDMPGDEKNASEGGENTAGDVESTAGSGESAAGSGGSVAGSGASAAGSGDGDGDELLIALRHPLRRQILRAMVRQDRISPRQISDQLRQPLSNVSYHVRVLAECGVVTLVDTTPVRGSMQHFYSPTIDEPWALEVLGISGNGESAPGGEDEEPAP